MAEAERGVHAYLRSAAIASQARSTASRAPHSCRQRSVSARHASCCRAVAQSRQKASPPRTSRTHRVATAWPHIQHQHPVAWQGRHPGTAARRRQREEYSYVRYEDRVHRLHVRMKVC